MKNTLIGASIGACGNRVGCEKAPFELQTKYNTHFELILEYLEDGRDFTLVSRYMEKLAHTVKHTIERGRPIVVGGDHSCAIGTWSGVQKYYSQFDQHLNLIWVDAHMDSHTPETSPTGNIHGMPLAVLLGYGNSQLSQILQPPQRLKPENLSIIGVRAFEEGEANLLQSLGVRIYFMEEIKQRTIDIVLGECYRKHSLLGPVGISIDVDAFDPEFAPGVGTPAKDGIHFDRFLEAFKKLDLTKLSALEITEYNPDLDIDGITRTNLLKILRTVAPSLSA